MSKFQINELTLETLCQNEHWTFTTKRHFKTRSNIRSNVSLILEEIIHKLLEVNVHYTISWSRHLYDATKFPINQKINELDFS